MTILVTGFEPFGGVGINPSQKIVEALAGNGTSRHGAELVTEILPTEYQAAGRRIVGLIREIQPTALLSLGLAASAAAVKLERVALNLNDGARPDNAGDLATGRPIEPDGPIGYWSTLPVDRMLSALRERDIPAIISNHAGAYVCNHVFYKARHEVERLGNPTAAGFVHVPLLAEQPDAPGAGGAKMPLSQLVEAIECCLDVLTR